MAKKAICIGINDYPGMNNDLNGCLNDMNDWAGLLTDQFGFDVTGLADDAATGAAILDALTNLVSGASAGDTLVMTFSGHGFYQLDGANADESDNYDEMICAHDMNIVDDEIRAVLDRIPDGVNMTVVSDSCHSGTVTRTMLDRTRNGDGTPDYPMLARYMPMENHGRFDTKIVPVRKRSFVSGASMNHLLLSGCSPVESSWDAWINGRYNGAMTANAISIIKQDPSISFEQLHTALRGRLPSRYYPQTPQLEGPSALKQRPIFT